MGEADKDEGNRRGAAVPRALERGSLPQFTLDYLKGLRDEINLRVNRHAYLVCFKLLALGGIMSYLSHFLAEQEGKSPAANSIGPVAHWLVWLAPLACLVLDTIIRGNLRSVRCIGFYIRDYWEKRVFSHWKKEVYLEEHQEEHQFLFWEEFLQKNQWCYTCGDMVVICSITWVSLAAAWLWTVCAAEYDTSSLVLASVFFVALGLSSTRVFARLWQLVESENTKATWDVRVFCEDPNTPRLLRLLLLVTHPRRWARRRSPRDPGSQPPDCKRTG